MKNQQELIYDFGCPVAELDSEILESITILQAAIDNNFLPRSGSLTEQTAAFYYAFEFFKAKSRQAENKSLERLRENNNG